MQKLLFLIPLILSIQTASAQVVDCAYVDEVISQAEQINHAHLRSAERSNVQAQNSGGQQTAEYLAFIRTKIEAACKSRVHH